MRMEESEAEPKRRRKMGSN